MKKKHIRVLKMGAEKLNLPYDKLKKAFKSLSREEREEFMKTAGMIEFIDHVN